jgi:hypothetical protein
MAKLRTRDGLAELQSAVWILHGSLDPLETLATCGQTPIAQDGFALRLRCSGRTAPIEARFRFIPEHTNQLGLAFTWSHNDDVPLPSMSGMLVARRFGPLLILSVHAHYSCGLDVPERLFFEAVGCRLAEKTFAGLKRALVYLLQHLPSRSMHEA